MKPLSRWRKRILSRFTYNHLIVSGIGDYLSSLVPWTLAIVMGKSPGTIGGSWGTYHIDQLSARYRDRLYKVNRDVSSWVALPGSIRGVLGGEEGGGGGPNQHATGESAAKHRQLVRFASQPQPDLILSAQSAISSHAHIHVIRGPR